MNFMKYHVSRNLFDVSTQTVGAFVRAGNTRPDRPLGNIEENAAYNLSAYILVSPNTTYTLHNLVDSQVSGAGLVYYDSNDTPISGVALIDQGLIYVFTTPSNCVSIRFSYDNTQGTDIMLNTGSTALPYEPYDDTWHNTPHYIMGTSTDTITTLPADLYPNDTTVTVGLKGNMVQNGTPTPTTPIQPSECGDRTENLFDVENVTHETLNADGSIRYESAMNLSGLIRVDGDYTVSWSAIRSGAYMRVSTYDDNKNFIARIAEPNTYTRSSYSNTHTGYIRINYENIFQLSDVQVNTGSTALPYEPYGYKIPISSASTTTPVYLGQVETTRRIEKLVLDGTENWTNQTLVRKLVSIAKPSGIPAGSVNLLSTHFVVTSSNDVAVGEFYAGGSWINFNYDNVNDLDTWKAYLQQQYAAGTPVTVWYVLATPTTGIVNEPIRKIGNYADTVSGITIPVTAGGDTLSVDTMIQPSEVAVNYKGWHNAEVKEWDGSEWQ